VLKKDPSGIWNAAKPSDTEPSVPLVACLHSWTNCKVSFFLFLTHSNLMGPQHPLPLWITSTVKAKNNQKTKPKNNQKTKPKNKTKKIKPKNKEIQKKYKKLVKLRSFVFSYERSELV